VKKSPEEQLSVLQVIFLSANTRSGGSLLVVDGCHTV